MTSYPSHSPSSGVSGSVHPNPARTIFAALAIQSGVVLLLTLTVMVAGVGIQQRSILALGVLLVLALALFFATQIGPRILERVAVRNHVSPVAAATSPIATSSPGPDWDSLLSQLPMAVISTHADGRIMRFNQAALQLTQKSPEALNGKSIREYFANFTDRAEWTGLESTLREGRTWKGELSATAPDGKRLSLVLSAVPQVGEGKGPRAVWYLLEDVTEVRQLSTLVIDMERLSTRGRMAGEIAHEINNFLTILGGNLDIIPMLLAAGQEEKVNQKFAAMKQVLEKIARFSDGLMGYRDNEAEPSPCDLNKMVEGLVAFLKPQNRYDGVQISVKCDAEMPKITAKVGQIQQVLVNLLNNATDAAREARKDQAVIVVETRWLPDRAQASISVQDNGGGLTEAARSRVFRERYSDKASGHGLGLLNCHKIALAHQGTLTVESRPGMGATFTLLLPRDAATQTAPPSRPQSPVAV